MDVNDRKRKKLLSRERIGGRPNPRYAFPKASLLQDQGCHIRYTGSNFTSQFNEQESIHLLNPTTG